MAIVHMISDTFLHHRELKFSELYQTQGHLQPLSKHLLQAAINKLMAPSSPLANFLSL